MNNIGFFGFIGWSAVCNWLSNFPSFQGLKPPARKSCVQFFCFFARTCRRNSADDSLAYLPCKCRVCPVRGRVFVFQGHVATICLTLTRKPCNAERGWVKNLWDVYGSIPIDTFLVGWTSIYQLFWGSLGTRVLTHPQMGQNYKLSWCQKPGNPSELCVLIQNGRHPMFSSDSGTQFRKFSYTVCI